VSTLVAFRKLGSVRWLLSGDRAGTTALGLRLAGVVGLCGVLVEERVGY
jgi:hypothetical protein